MQFQSDSVLKVAEPKVLPHEFPATHMDYIQEYHSQERIHYHDCLEIGLCVQGNGTLMINNQIYPFPSNSITVIQGNCLHEAHVLLKNKNEINAWKYIFVTPEFWGMNCREFGGFLCKDSQLITLFHMMYNELEEKPDNYQSMFPKLLSVFLTYTERIAPLSFPIHYGSLPAEMLYVIQRIHSTYNETITVSQLAKECNMSVSSFCRTFHQFFDMPPLSYVNEIRLNIARHLLQTTDIPILAISLEVGYKSLSSFNRLFVKKYGDTPRNIRKKAYNVH